jgi:hypothetical protein
MKRRSYAGTALLWFLLVIAFSLALHRWGGAYHRAIAATGEAIASAFAPADVVVRIEVKQREFSFSAGRGRSGQRTSFSARLMDASAALLLATVLLTPLGSVSRRLLVAAAAFGGLIAVLGGVAAGLAFVPMVRMGFLTSRVAWTLAALAHNASTSGLIISAPAAAWFLLTFSWWRQGFARPAKGREGKGRRAGTARGRKGRRGGG